MWCSVPSLCQVYVPSTVVTSVTLERGILDVSPKNHAKIVRERGEGDRPILAKRRILGGFLEIPGHSGRILGEKKAMLLGETIHNESDCKYGGCTTLLEATYLGTSEKMCKGCKRVFTPTSPAHLYCTTSCRPKKGITRVEKACDICGEKFLAGKIEVTCSETCRVEKKHREYLKRYTPRTLHNRICKYCAKPFNGKISANYCSDECRKLGYTKRRSRLTSNIGDKQ